MTKKSLLKTIIFLLPTQLGLHFWPSFSRVAGIKIDYLSPTLYLVDLLILLYILFSVKKVFYHIKKQYKIYLVIFSLALLNTVFSISPANTFFWYLHLLVYLLFFLSIRQNKAKWKEIQKPLLLSTVLIVSIELFQLLRQSSLGGLLYYLGERSYSPTTQGLARLNFFGREILRPPSTFSHPNSLAGYLLIVFYLFSRKSKNHWQKTIPFVGIILTFSKTAIVSLSFLIFGLNSGNVILLSLFITTLLPIVSKYIHSSWQPLSDRLFHIPYTHKILLANPFTGVGYGNFIPSLGSFLPGSFLTPSKLQPIHNLPYLYATETGLLGLASLVLILLSKKIKRLLSKKGILDLLAIVIFTGTFDHYTWTLPQNKLILVVALAIMI